MLILGLVLFIIGYFTAISLLETLGIILLVIGAILFMFGAVGSPVAGRRYWW